MYLRLNRYRAFIGLGIDHGQRDFSHPQSLAIPCAGKDYILHVRAAQALALCSPRTQLTPSRMLDLPQPFGPTTTAMPVPGTVKLRAVAKTLKPEDVDFL